MSEKSVPPEITSFVDNMTAFGKHFTLIVDGYRIPVTDFVIEPKPSLDTTEMLTLTTTSNITIEGELTLTEEQQAEMAKYWEDLWQRELMRQLMGQPSEYAESLRASKAKI